MNKRGEREFCSPGPTKKLHIGTQNEDHEVIYPEPPLPAYFRKNGQVYLLMNDSDKVVRAYKIEDVVNAFESIGSEKVE